MISSLSAEKAGRAGARDNKRVVAARELKRGKETYISERASWRGSSSVGANIASVIQAKANYFRQKPQ